MGYPPFSDMADFAEKVGELVPDTKGGYDDADFVDAALRAYSGKYPAEDTADIGDSSTQEWVMGTAPFADWAEGFSDQWPVEIEQLDGGTPTRPQTWLRRDIEWWWERRDSSGLKRVLVFADAPDATDQVRVHWKRPFAISGSTVEVPTAHQMAVVYRACQLKCEALASWYQRTIDPAGGSDIFDGVAYVDRYAEGAKRWAKLAGEVLGVETESTHIRRARIRTGRDRVFHRWPR